MPTFREIQDEIRNIMDVPTDQMDEDQKAAWDAYADELGCQEQDKVDGYGQFRVLEKARAEALAAEGKRLLARSKSILNNLDYLDGRYLGAMQEHGLKKVNGQVYSISVRATDVVEVTDEDALPEEFRRTTVTVAPDKVAIKDALKQGFSIPGAQLAKSYSLRVA